MVLILDNSFLACHKVLEFLLVDVVKKVLDGCVVLHHLELRCAE